MARAPVLDQLTASELFLLLWDDYGWSNDIGGPAVCGGANLLDGMAGSGSRRCAGGPSPDCTWFPGSGSCCTGPDWGWAGNCGSTLRPST